MAKIFIVEDNTWHALTVAQGTRRTIPFVFFCENLGDLSTIPQGNTNGTTRDH